MRSAKALSLAKVCRSVCDSLYQSQFANISNGIEVLRERIPNPNDEKARDVYCVPWLFNFLPSALCYDGPVAQRQTAQCNEPQSQSPFFERVGSYHTTELTHSADTLFRDALMMLYDSISNQKCIGPMTTPIVRLPDSFQLADAQLQLLEAMQLPVPTDSPNQRIQQLMAVRNEWKLHRRKCDKTGDSILSAYPPDTEFPVYRNSVWWGDAWNPLESGRDFDFSRPFFEQLAELQAVVPREGTSVFSSENCEYNGHTRESRNCYMNSLVYRCEDTLFSYWVVNNKDVVDCLLVNGSTLAYECIDCENLYDCVLLQECHNCQDCHFSYQLRGCEHCIGCSNLVNKKYHIQNQAVSPEEFEKQKRLLLDGSREAFHRGWQLFSRTFAAAAHRCVHNLNCENVIGDHLLNSRNCHMVFDSANSEDAAYCISVSDSNDLLLCYSAGWPKCEQVYCSAVTRGSSDIAFCYYTFFSSGLRYCDSSMNCQDCFGCIGLRRSKNCILNKEYSPEEYRRLRSKVIDHMKQTGEWGQYFPISMSTFCYNDSAAQDYFPIVASTAKENGWRWHEQVDAATASAENTLHCAMTKKPYRIVKQEAEFYRKMSLPEPEFHPQTRHAARLARRNPYQMRKARCAVSAELIDTSFDLESANSICSEAAYLKSLQ